MDCTKICLSQLKFIFHWNMILYFSEFFVFGFAIISICWVKIKINSDGIPQNVWLIYSLYAHVYMYVCVWTLIRLLCPEYCRFRFSVFFGLMKIDNFDMFFSINFWVCLFCISRPCFLRRMQTTKKKCLTHIRWKMNFDSERDSEKERKNINIQYWYQHCNNIPIIMMHQTKQKQKFEL